MLIYIYLCLFQVECMYLKIYILTCLYANNYVLNSTELLRKKYLFFSFPCNMCVMTYNEQCMLNVDINFCSVLFI